MSQSTRSGSKHAIRLSNDEAEVRDALLERTEGSAAGLVDAAEGAEDTAARP